MLTGKIHIAPGTYKRILLFTIAAAVITFTNLTGWFSGINVLTTFYPGWPGTKVNTAFGLLLSCSCLLFLLHPERKFIIIIRSFAVAIFLLGLLTLTEYITGINTGIDEFILSDTFTAAAAFPGRMSFASAALFCLTAISLYCASVYQKRWRIAGDLCSLAVCTFSFISFTGFIFKASLAFKVVQFVSIAFPTTVGFFCINAALLVQNPFNGFFYIFGAKTASGKSGLRLLLTVLLLLPLIGLLRLRGQHAGMYDTEFGLSLMVISFAILFTTVIWLHTKKLAETELYKLSALMDTSPEATLIINERGIIQLVNAQTETVFGYTKQDLAGEHISLLLKAGNKIDNKTFEKFFKNRIAEKKILMLELQALRKDTSTFSAEINFSALDGKEGNLTAASVRDISVRKAGEEKLKQLNEQLLLEVKEKNTQIKNMYERIADGFMAFDKDWNFIYLNHKALEIMKKDAAEVIGKSIWLEYPQLADSVFYDACMHAMELQIDMNVEVQGQLSGNWYENHLYPSPGGLSVYFVDVTDKRRTNQSLKDSEEKFAKAFYDNVTGVCLADEHARIIDVNPAFEKIIDYRLEEIIGKTPYEAFSLRPLVDSGNFQKQMREKGSFINTEFELFTKLGKRVVTLASMTKINVNGSNQRLTTVIDITEKKLAEEELEKTYDELRTLSGHLQNIREEESRRIAREIHDELGQQLTALKMDCFWLKKNMQKEENPHVKKLDEMLELVSLTTQSVRRIASNLRPPVLDDLGLTAALEWQSREIQKRTDLKINFKAETGDVEFPAQITTGLFRVYQEALTNVLRHADATQVDAGIKLSDGKVLLTITDNGKGIETKNGKPKSFGLIGMKERVHMMSGHFEIKSKPGKGTSVLVEVPLTI